MSTLFYSDLFKNNFFVYVFGGELWLVNEVEYREQGSLKRLAGTLTEVATTLGKTTIT